MSELAERWPGDANRFRKIADRIDELEAEVHRLHTAEFVGRLPDYVKELETERDEAHRRIDELEAKVAYAYDHEQWCGDSDMLRFMLDTWDKHVEEAERP